MLQEALSGIDVILKKRFDLIPNLVETVKGYLTHEKETLANIVSLRNQALNAGSADEKLQFDKKLRQCRGNYFCPCRKLSRFKSQYQFFEFTGRIERNRNRSRTIKTIL